MNSNTTYLSGLHGIRAVAAFSVLISHITTAYFGYNTYSQFLINLSSVGVTMFFVLSGFLISFIALKKSTEYLNIKNFYVRRILRIWPIYYLFLSIALVILYLMRSENLAYSYFYIFLLANVPISLGIGIPLITHLWSIGVEEQFYLIYPHILKQKKIKLSSILIALILILFAAKIIFGFINHDSFIYHFLQLSRFDCMLIGGLTAYLYIEGKKILAIFNNETIQITLWICLILLSFCSIKICQPFIHEVISIITAGIIIGQINIKKRVVNLDSKPLQFLGEISYGIYIFHPIMIALSIWLKAQLNIHGLSEHIFVYLSSIILTIAIAYFSYNLIEKHFINMKHRFA